MDLCLYGGSATTMYIYQVRYLLSVLEIQFLNLSIF